MRKFLIIVVLIISGCGGQIPSSTSYDGAFLLQPRVTDGLVFFDISDTKSSNIYTIDTQASDYQKWSAGWLPNSNIVLLYSSDIGTYAWQYKSTWVSVELTMEMEIQAENLYKTEYK